MPSGSFSSPAEPLPPRGSFGLIIDRQFGSIFWGKLLSGIGVWIQGIVAAIVVYAATGSALWVGLVSAAQFAPQLVLSPLSGKWADRGNIAFQLIVGRALTMAGAAFLTFWCWIDGDPQGYGGAVAVLFGSFVTGLGFVVGGPAQQSIIPLLVRPGELGIAMGLNSFPMTVARVVGPPAGAVIAAQLSAAYAFALATVTHLLFVVLLLYASLPAGVEHDDDADFSLRSALRHVRSDRTLLLLLLIVAAAGFASEPTITLAPTFADALGGGDQLVGQLAGSFGLGAGAGYVLYARASRRWSNQRLTQVALILMAAGSAAVAVADRANVVLVVFAAIGLGFMIVLTAATTLIQERVPPLLRGRVMALWFVGFAGSRPLAAVFVGWVADTFSLAVSLLMIAGLVALILVIYRPQGLDFSEASRLGVRS